MLLSGQTTADGTGFMPGTVAFRLRRTRCHAPRANGHRSHCKIANNDTD